jgi:AbrB family looped-hinge helix DNA binding protein
MPRITSKGQVTIPKGIRNKFGFLPGMEVEFIVDGQKAMIVKSRQENKFIRWLGRGRTMHQIEVDKTVNQMRGNEDE